MENVFKEICRQYIGKVIWTDFDGDRNLIPGHWWGLDMTTGMSAEIDIMLKNDDGILLLGMCRWSEEKMGVEDMETLIWHSRMFKEEKKRLYLFSKGGFTERCIEAAKDIGNIKLKTYDDIFKEIMAV